MTDDPVIALIGGMALGFGFAILFHAQMSKWLRQNDQDEVEDRAEHALNLYMRRDWSVADAAAWREFRDAELRDRLGHG